MRKMGNRRSYHTVRRPLRAAAELAQHCSQQMADKVRRGSAFISSHKQLCNCAEWGRVTSQEQAVSTI